MKHPHEIPPTKYHIQDQWKSHSIGNDINKGPIIGCNDIRIEDKCNVNKNYFTYYDFKPGEYCFQYNNGKNRLTFTGTYYYYVDDIEIFQIVRESHF